MTKTKLALLLFCAAFGLNIIAFVFSKKTFTIEEDKKVWLYELPQTLSPMDAYPALTMGPHNGVIGTLFLPTGQTIQNELADQWTWNEKTREFKATLRAGLTYSDGSPINASDWVQSLQWAQTEAKTLAVTPEWQAFSELQASAPDARTLVLKWEKLPKDFEFQTFAERVLTHPLSGVFHPANLKRLQANERIVKDWISSGPYKVRKWNPKEIALVSRDPFPIQLPKEFFRTIHYQSAPVKNPSCDFMQADSTQVVQQAGHNPEPADKDLKDHAIVGTRDEMHVFWICRSWKQAGSFCKDPLLRKSLVDALAGRPAAALSGKTVKYRIPVGSDEFRTTFRKRLEDSLRGSGGVAKEVSYFFKGSKDADLELGFVTVPTSPKSDELAQKFMELSSRMGSGSWIERNVIGRISKFPLMVLIKNLPSGDLGDPFKKVFLEPDVAEKQLPL
ncbi:MAG: hypothetical protein JST80_00340 [Bdellovibrionales bacterium]|nr:hypothetical protein [Bdellovibrionales bacterium]